MTVANKAPKNQFTISIDVELPPAAVQNIVQAVQKAVLNEIAGAKLKTPIAIDFLAGGTAASPAIFGIPTGTQGIAIRTAEE